MTSEVDWLQVANDLNVAERPIVKLDEVFVVTFYVPDGSTILERYEDERDAHCRKSQLSRLARKLGVKRPTMDVEFRLAG